MLELQLEYQGANPKKLDFKELKTYIQSPLGSGAIENEARARIRSRATAIRAYCMECMGGDKPLVRSCASLTCPLHPFRMGKDPLRGFELPKADEIEIEFDEDDLDQFEDEDDND